MSKHGSRRHAAPVTPSGINGGWKALWRVLGWGAAGLAALLILTFALTFIGAMTGLVSP